MFSHNSVSDRRANTPKWNIAALIPPPDSAIAIFLVCVVKARPTIAIYGYLDAIFGLSRKCADSITPVEVNPTRSREKALICRFFTIFVAYQNHLRRKIIEYLLVVSRFSAVVRSDE